MKMVIEGGHYEFEPENTEEEAEHSEVSRMCANESVFVLKRRLAKEDCVWKTIMLAQQIVDDEADVAVMSGLYEND
jgi:hypothetical protein